MRAFLVGSLVLVYLTWSLLEGCLLPPRFSVPAAASNPQQRAHTDYCHCRLCPGPRVCCCRPTPDRVLAAVLQGACDASLAVTLACKTPQALPPLAIGPLRALPETTLTFPTLIPLARTRPQTPPEPPPRLLRLYS